MPRILLAAFVFSMLSIFLRAQPQLEIKPDRIKFENTFDRLKNIYLINKGDSLLTIDSIYYKADLYYVRFDEYWNYPLNIPPGDTVTMDCILSGYLDVTLQDVQDTMYFAANGYKTIQPVNIDIGFYQEGNTGIISGRITDGINPVDGATVKIMYEGSYTSRTVISDENGYYHASLPEGRYTVAAYKDSFPAVFYGQAKSPYQADLVELTRGNSATGDIQMEKPLAAGFKLSGKIKDKLTTFPLRRAVVVMRKGLHNPRKGTGKIEANEIAVSAFTDSYGNFSAELPEAGYYYIQAFSDYFIPSYFSTDSSQILWQQADSIEITSSISDLNIDLPRDSSYGGGTIDGKIYFDNIVSDSLEGTLVFAQSLSNDFLYSFGFARDAGEFRITNLPYGSYRLFAQKIGYENSFSNIIEITPSSNNIKNIELHIRPASVSEDKLIPRDIYLYQNYPNPFNPSTTIEFDLASGNNVKLSIYNMLGQEIKTLLNGYMPAGKYKNTFSLVDFSSGAYIIMLKTASKTVSRKIILLK